MYRLYQIKEAKLTNTAIHIALKRVRAGNFKLSTIFTQWKAVVRKLELRSLNQAYEKAKAVIDEGEIAEEPSVWMVKD